MRPYQLALTSSISILLLFGCSTEREPESGLKNQAAVEKPTDQPSEIIIKAREISPSVIGSTVDKTIEIAEQTVINTKEELAKKTEGATKKVSQRVAEKTTGAAKSAVDSTTVTTDKAEILVEKTVESINSADNIAKVSAPLKIPETIILKNNKGEITLPHKRHAATFACTHCHGDATPGPIELGQEKGHAICKGCHQAKGGPIACVGCHAKKAIKPVEGC
jgi:hypothetical protein